MSLQRFTVASRTVEGDSAESEPSVAVRPNEPLPEGWKEKFNAVTGKVGRNDSGFADAWCEFGNFGHLFESNRRQRRGSGRAAVGPCKQLPCPRVNERKANFEVLTSLEDPPSLQCLLLLCAPRRVWYFLRPVVTTTVPVRALLSVNQVRYAAKFQVTL